LPIRGKCPLARVLCHYGPGVQAGHAHRRDALELVNSHAHGGPSEVARRYSPALPSRLSARPRGAFRCSSLNTIFDLIQPGSIDRQPMEVGGEWQVERPDPGRQALGGMRGAVVQDHVETANPPTPDTAEEHPQEALELDEPLALKAARQGFASVHQQAADQLDRALALIAIRQVQWPAGPRRGRAPARLPGLDRRLLVRADDEVARPGEPLGAFVV
jgi:hypothetical protein